MRAALLTAVGQPLELADIEAPALGPLDVLVEVRASGVCHSDVTIAAGSVPSPLPLILGHEGSGVVAEVGNAVTRVRVGDKVVRSFTPTCGPCWHCLRHESHLCEDMSGTFTARGHGTGGEAVYGRSGLGTFAESMSVPESFLVKVRSDLPAEQLAPLGCGATTGLVACRL